MQRWLRMATAHTLLCRRPLCARLRHGYILSSTSRQVRTATHAVAAAQSAADNVHESYSSVGEGNLGNSDAREASIAWYKVRDKEREIPLRDVAYYANLPYYPKPEDYHTLAKDFFLRPPSVGLMSTVTSLLKSQGVMSEWRELLKRPERLIWRHNFVCRWGNDRLQIVGEGVTPDMAYAAAFLGFIHQLHVFGWLQRVLDQKDLNETLLSKPRTFAWSPSDIAAKMHIHNFAARYLRTPVITFEDQKGGSVRATVVIPNTNHIASAEAGDRKRAEFQAYAAMKDSIHSSLAQKGKSIDLQESTFVNLDNAPQLLDFYKLKARYGHYNRRDKHVPGPESGTWTASRLFWDDRPISRFHVMPTRRDAMKLCGLEAAVRIVRDDPSLLAEYQEVSKETAGFVPKRLPPTFASLNSSVVGTLADCVQVASDEQLELFQLSKYIPGYKPIIGRWSRNEIITSEDRYHNVAQSLASRSDELKLQQEWDRESPAFAERQAARARLPIFQHQAQIIAMTKNHDQCIIVGSTGSGKSTQVPQIILDDAIAEGRGALCNIMCTQPRRFACVALALTVCNEREKALGDIVGYRIGGDYHNFSRKGGSITYLTTELLANELERAENELPHNVSHIIIDEIHERSVHLDRLLSTIKMQFSKRLAAGLRLPKLILMSATVESDLFERYFEMVSQDGTVIRPPYLNVPGRMFQTETKFLDSYEHLLPQEMHQAINSMDQHDTPLNKNFSLLPPVTERPKQVIQWNSAFQQANERIAIQGSLSVVAASIIHIVENTQGGAILAFVPGAREIRSVHQALLNQKRVDLADGSRFEILMLHRSNPAHLAAALGETPNGIRRIMISTNISESSITFPDVEYVVDSGLRRTVGDMRVGTLQVLKDERISRASVLQRAGRAGRTKPGQYYGAFTMDEMREFDVFTDTEDMDRHRLESLYLRAKIHFPAASIEEYFNTYLTPIPKAKVQAARSYLRSIGALDASGDVTMIGYFLYRTTLAPSLARMVLLGLLFRCLDRAIVLANLLSSRFYVFGDSRFDNAMPMERRAVAEQFVGDSESDLIAQLRAFEEYSAIKSKDAGAAREWAEQRGLAWEHLDLLQSRIQSVQKVLDRAGFYGHRWAHDINASEDNVILLKIIICAGLYPNVATHQRGASFVTHQSLVVKPSPASVTLPGDYTDPKTFDAIHNGFTGATLCYKDLVASAQHGDRYYIFNLTPISPLMLALFSNDVKPKPAAHNQLLIDDSISLKFSGDAMAASVFLDFKRVFDTALLAGMQNVCEIWPSNKRKLLETTLSDIVLGAVQELLEYEDGQAKRRHDDVGKFSLEAEKEAWDYDEPRAGEAKWMAMDTQAPDTTPEMSKSPSHEDDGYLPELPADMDHR